MILLDQQNRIKITFLIAVIALAVLSCMSYIRIQHLITESELVHHTQIVKLQLEKIATSVIDAETNQKNYLLTGNSIVLANKQIAFNTLTRELNKADSLIRDNRVQVENLKILHTAINSKLWNMDRIMFLYNMSKFMTPEFQSTIKEGVYLTSKIQQQTNKMQDEEDRLLKMRLATFSKSAFLTPMYNIILIIGVIIILIASYVKISGLNEAVNESKERYHLMVEGVQDYAILYLNRSGIIENWNTGAERIKGYKAQEIIGQSFSRFYTEEDKENNLPQKILALAVENDKAVQEGWRVRKDGSLFWASVVITAIHNEKNEVIGFSKVTHDLTQKKAAEDLVRKNSLLLEQYNIELEKANRELSAQKEFSETILNTTPDLIAAYDTEMRIIAFNKACEDLFHMGKEDVIGKVYLDVFPSAKNKQGHQDLMRALSGETIHNAIYKSILAERYYENFITPLKDVSGKVTAAVAIAHDTTDIILSTEKIQKANEELNESNERFFKIFDNNPIPMTLSEIKTNKIKYANKPFYAAFGYDEKEVIEHTSEELNLVGPEENQRLITLILGYLQEGRSLAELRALSVDETEELLIKLKQADAMKNLEVLYTRKNGEVFPAEVSYEIIRIGAKKYTIASYQDITERKKIREQLTSQNEDLLKANKELEAFTYISSHDLQEPLRQIQNFASRILDTEEQNLSERGKNYFEKMNNAAKRMQTLITDLLAYSRIKVTEKKYKMIDLKQIVNEVTEDLAETIIEKNATIEVDGLGYVNVIPFQFRQMMQNLIGNALKFSKPDTKPHIIIKNSIVKESEVLGSDPATKTEYCHISITDNGIGFDPIYKERIFEVFQRLHDKQKIAGTGIGLAVVKKIVENHNGIITATSAPNEGATFNIYLPASQTQSIPTI